MIGICGIGGKVRRTLSACVTSALMLGALILGISTATTASAAAIESDATEILHSMSNYMGGLAAYTVARRTAAKRRQTT